MKKKLIKSAIPIYAAAAVWLLFGLIAGRQMLKLWFILLVAVISLAAYFVCSKIFKGREVEVREKANSGDKSVDELIEIGRKRLDALRAANVDIEDPVISEKLSRMEAAGEEIFNVLEKDTKQAHAVRRFMNYYLPTAEKLMEAYRQIDEKEGENVDRIQHSVENSLSMIADAFEKQLDNLYKDKALDIETDIDVMQTMLASDGLVQQKSPGI